MAVVAIIRKGSSQNPLAMHLMRALFFITAKYRFTISATHIPGTLNCIADAISRNNVARFFSLVPQANPTPTPVPPELLRVLIHNQPNWMSNNWRAMFSSSFQRD